MLWVKKPQRTSRSSYQRSQQIKAISRRTKRVYSFSTAAERDIVHDGRQKHGCISVDGGKRSDKDKAYVLSDGKHYRCRDRTVPFPECPVSVETLLVPAMNVGTQAESARPHHARDVNIPAMTVPFGSARLTSCSCGSGDPSRKRMTLSILATFHVIHAGSTSRKSCS